MLVIVNKKHHGFTLIEMLISIVVIGAVLAITSGLFAQTTSLERKTERLAQKDLSVRTARIIEAFADSELNGRLPSPLFEDEYYSTFVLDTESSSFITSEAFLRNMSVEQLANNGKASPQQRVYQVIRDLTFQTTTRGFAGPLVNLTYDIGVVYMSGCSISDITCHPNADTNIAGFSPLFTTDNAATFDVIEPDYGLARLSSLGIQRRLLKESMERIDDVQAALSAYFTARYLAAPPDPEINHYPGGTGVIGTRDPIANNGCAEDWIDLSGTTEAGREVMYQIGLQSALRGKTAWGGPIQYCRDYMPDGIGTAGASPHNAALRIHRDVSTAASPTTAENTVIFAI